jgi:hypothetical protein
MMANKYLKFEYWNTCDLGNIYYQGGQHFWFYLDGDVLEPFHEDTEDGQEDGDGDFVPTFRRQMKRYRIKTSLVPDYLIDAIQRMKLHDNIELTFKTGEVEQIYNLDVEPEWQFEKKCWQGTVVLTFDMDEKVVLGACCDNLTVGAEVEPEPVPDLYWVMSTGSNNSGDGSYANPWQTFGYATTQATTPGDIIHMKANDTITEAVQSNLALGVSIVGVDNTSIITTSAALNPIIELLSAAEGTDGNQSISYVKFDGNNLTGTRAVYVYLRKNVSIHHVTVKDFSAKGIDFDGSLGATPTTHATGNEIYNCTFINTCGRGGAICFTGQAGMLIHDNTITGYQRVLGHDPTLVSMTGGYNKDIRFYNNVLNMDRLYFAVDGTTSLWGFHFESWDCQGGFQVYNNTFNGGHVPIDIGGSFNIKGAYDYSWDIHDNTWQWSAQWANQVDGSFGLVMEGGVADVRIHNNHFINVPWGINSSILQASKIIENIYIYYNILENMGWGDDVWGFGMWIGQGVADAITRYVFIFNNVIDSGTGAEGSLSAGILVNSSNSVTNIMIQNNVIQNVTGYGMIAFYNWAPGMTIANVYVRNNVYYNNTNSDDIYYNVNAVVTALTESNNIKDNPDFVTPAPHPSDFHLIAGSPCINVGLATLTAFITTDYDGDTIADPPDIGAYEF